MSMIGHNDEFMQQIFLLRAVIKKRLNQKPRPLLQTKNRSALPCDSCDKKCALGFHGEERINAKRELIVMRVTRMKK